MCGDLKRVGFISLPEDTEQRVNSGIEECQKTGVFINQSDRECTVRTSQGVYLVPAGSTITVPVDREVYVKGLGRGNLHYVLLTDVLPVQLPTQGTSKTFILQPGQALDLSGGHYSKLLFIQPEVRFNS